MNSQQELLDAINAIKQDKNKSFDTPATVLRVEGDTAWVHIDGGADETPVNKTINCEQGETVQVRISNGSAFLVGNASAPPTDDKTANQAHFVAEQADEKATKAINSVNAIVQTVEGKVDIGDSNITDISSTMYQDAYGVNIFNDTLAVGDSYAHIDGNSFDIKQATTAGTIDNTNDPVLATFGGTSAITHYEVDALGYSRQSTFTFDDNSLELEYKYPFALVQQNATLLSSQLGFSNGSSGVSTYFGHSLMYDGTGTVSPTSPDTALYYSNGGLVVRDSIKTAAYKDLNGNSVLDEWTATATVSSGSIIFSGLDSTLDYSRPYFENGLYNVTSMSVAGSGSIINITFTTDAPDNTVGKLRILR